MALDERAQAGLARVQSSHLQEMTKLVHQDTVIEGVQQGLHLLEELSGGFFRKVAFLRRKRNGDFELLGQREIDRKNGTKFLPFFRAGDFRAQGRGHLECGSLGHGRVIQSQRPNANLTATALRPS